MHRMLLNFACLASIAATPSPAAEPVDYLWQVKPLLAARCYSCHSPLHRQSGLRLDTAALAVQGGSRGPAIVLGDREGSLLMQAVRGVGNIGRMLPALCRQTDRACAALLTDLKRRGLLEDTLVVYGGEFGRTAVGQVNPTGAVGRDHQIAAFTMWLAGGGVRPGITWGETDELGCYPVHGSLSVHDLHATILHLLGLDHERLTYRHQGRDFRLTDVAGQVVTEVLA